MLSLLFAISIIIIPAVKGGDSVTILVDGKTTNTTQLEKQHAPRVTLLVSHHNTSSTIHLLLNTFLISSNFSEKVVGRDSSYKLNRNQSEDFCYYVGAVKGVSDSSAAFTSCPRLKGFFRVGSKTWHVEVFNNGSQHISSEHNNNITTWLCGVKELKRQVDALKEARKRSPRHKRQISEGSLQGMLVVELYLVNDLSRFRQYGRTDKVFDSSKEIANVANLLYQPLGLMVVLVGVEVWTDRDRIYISRDSKTTLKNWMTYRASQVDVYNDVGYLMSRTEYDGSILGLANIDTMCSHKESGGIIRSIDERTDVTGAILAHEIGHNFNFKHDTNDCTCEDQETRTCIMSSRASTTEAHRFFSSCSKEQLVMSLNKGADLCLHNTPHSFNHYLAVCGNGIVETGEECDCGRLPSHMCNRKCCNENTCRLKGACAQGGCCDVSSCSIRSSGHVCRPEAAGSCDLPETCDGKSSLCPKDAYVQDGTVCSAYGKEGSCFGGRCGNREAQCKLLYGQNARDASEVCYRLNSRGNAHGYCSYSLNFQSQNQHRFSACSSSDIMCGSLKCFSKQAELAKFTKFLTKSIMEVSGEVCYSTLFDYGKQVTDPGLVPDGSPCGQDMVCLKNICVERSLLLASMPCLKCINGRCNNKGVCHCNAGFVGLTCETAQSSGQTGLIVGLIIFFLLLFLIAALFIYDYRHQQHAIKFFKDLADKYTPDSTAKSSSTPPKTRTTRPPLQKRDIINTSATDTPQISIIPTRAAPKPSKVNPAAATAAHNSIPNRFDNPAYVSEDLDAVGLGNSRLNKPFKPPLPKSLPSHPKSSGNDLEKPNANPPLPPVVPAWKQNKAKKTGQVQKPTIPPNPPKMNKKVSEVVRRFDEGHNNPNFNSSA